LKPLARMTFMATVPAPKRGDIWLVDLIRQSGLKFAKSGQRWL